MRRLYHYRWQKTQDQRSVHKMCETDVSRWNVQNRQRNERETDTLILIGSLRRPQSGMIRKNVSRGRFVDSQTPHVVKQKH